MICPPSTIRYPLPTAHYPVRVALALVVVGLRAPAAVAQPPTRGESGGRSGQSQRLVSPNSSLPSIFDQRSAVSHQPSAVSSQQSSIIDPQSSIISHQSAPHSWQAPQAQDVKRQVFAWLDDRDVDEATRAKAEALWSAPWSTQSRAAGAPSQRAIAPGSAPPAPDSREPAGTELLMRVVRTFALADERARTLVELTSKPRRDVTPPRAEWLLSAATSGPPSEDRASHPEARPALGSPRDLPVGSSPRSEDRASHPEARPALGSPKDRDAGGLVDDFPGAGGGRGPKTSPLVANNLRLLYGRWLAQESLFDEALEQLDGLRPQDVVDPATLLFYQAVVHHRLLHRDAALKATEQLLAGPGAIPRRYQAVARLMEADLKALRADSLDHIARRMEDVGRRLALGRAGPVVRGVEDGVVESLDKLIQKLEDQQQAEGAGSTGRAQPSSPAQESWSLGGKGRGEVAKRNIGDTAGWGDLPPKERDEALQQIGRQFPAHYRDVIEQYFRRLANRESEDMGIRD
jgi:hypothetical protein